MGLWSLKYGQREPLVRLTSWPAFCLFFYYALCPKGTHHIISVIFCIFDLWPANKMHSYKRKIKRNIWPVQEQVTIRVSLGLFFEVRLRPLDPLHVTFFPTVIPFCFPWHVGVGIPLAFYVFIYFASNSYSSCSF